MKKFYEYESYRDCLRTSLAELQRVNPRFSREAFSRKLGISAPHLSQVLSGKKNLSLEQGGRVARALGFTEEQSHYFLLLLERELVSGQAQSLVSKRLKSLRSRSEIKREKKQNFENLSWEHLFFLVVFSQDPRAEERVPQICRSLGIDEAKAKAMIEELTRRKWLEKTAAGRVRTHRKVVFEATQANFSMKALHEGFLKLVAAFLYERPPQDRFSATEFFLVPNAKFEEVRALSNEYLDELQSLSGAEKNDVSVVGLSLHLCKLV